MQKLQLLSQISGIYIYFVAYRSFARQRPRNKQRDIRTVSEKRLDKHVPAETRRTQQYSYNENGGVFCVVRAEELKLRHLGQSNSILVREGALLKTRHNCQTVINIW
jgi:hypothetical protein